MHLRQIPAAVLPLVLTGLCVLHYGATEAQELNAGISTIRDGNIFDIYTPTADRITQVQADVTHGWELDRLSINAAYTGMASFFRDLDARNYHAHLVALISEYHFSTHDVGEETVNAADSDGVETDSAHLALNDPPPLPGGESADSLDEILYASATGGVQFDKSTYSQFDNSRISGTIAFRQPIGVSVSARTSYTFAYHAYPNLSGLTYFENYFSLLLGTSILHGGWINLIPAYGIKKYTAAAYMYSFTPRRSNPTGHGKAGGGPPPPITRSITLTTPSVSQFTATASWEQELPTKTAFTAGYSYFGVPTSKARLLPQEVSNVFERFGVTSSLSSPNEIFDDRYGYSGNEVSLHVRQEFPFGVTASVGGQTLHKTYTLDALAFDSTSAVGGSRVDTRVEGEFSLSKSIPFNERVVLKPQLEAHFIRNDSNAPYYAFDKTTFLFGVELNF